MAINYYLFIIIISLQYLWQRVDYTIETTKITWQKNNLYNITLTNETCKNESNRSNTSTHGAGNHKKETYI